MAGRRLLILVAVLMGLMVLAASVAPPPQAPRRAPGATATPAPGAGAQAGTPVAELPPGGTGVALTLDVARGRDHVDVRAGTALELQVVARATGSVEIVGMSEVAAVDPASPARFALSADAPGHFPVRLVEGGKPLGELVVTR